MVDTFEIAVENTDYDVAELIIMPTEERILVLDQRFERASDEVTSNESGNTTES